MKIRVSIERHVKVEYNVDLLNIDTTSKELCSYENTVSKLLETFVDL